MDNLPAPPPPAYIYRSPSPPSSQDQERNNDYMSDLPNYVETPLFPYYQIDERKDPPNYASSSISESYNFIHYEPAEADLERQHAQAQSDLHLHMHTNNSDSDPIASRKAQISNEQRSKRSKAALRARGSRKPEKMMHYFHPHATFQAVKRLGGRSKKTAGSVWDVSCSCLAVLAYVMLWLVYFAVCLGVPVLVICQWAGVKF